MKRKEYCSSKLYGSGAALDPAIVTERLQIEPDRLRLARGGKLATGTRAVWRKAIEKDKEGLDVVGQLEYWCRLLNGRKEQLASLQILGWEFEIDCFISHGAVALITLSPGLLENLASLRVGLSLSFYDKTGKV